MSRIARFLEAPPLGSRVGPQGGTLLVLGPRGNGPSGCLVGGQYRPSAWAGDRIRCGSRNETGHHRGAGLQGGLLRLPPLRKAHAF